MSAEPGTTTTAGAARHDCPCYFGCGTRGNRVAWAVFVSILGLGSACLMAGLVLTSTCTARYDNECTPENGVVGEQQRTLPDDAANGTALPPPPPSYDSCYAYLKAKRCPLSAYGNVYAAGYWLVTVAFLVTAYFCCCSSVPANHSSLVYPAPPLAMVGGGGGEQAVGPYTQPPAQGIPVYPGGYATAADGNRQPPHGQSPYGQPPPYYPYQYVQLTPAWPVGLPVEGVAAADPVAPAGTAVVAAAAGTAPGTAVAAVAGGGVMHEAPGRGGSAEWDTREGDGRPPMLPLLPPGAAGTAAGAGPGAVAGPSGAGGEGSEGAAAEAHASQLQRPSSRGYTIEVVQIK